MPYDVVNTEEARALAAGNPLSFLHVSRAEIDLPPRHESVRATPCTAKAVENFAVLQAQAPLVLEEAPTLYVYRLQMGDARADRRRRLLLRRGVRATSSRSTSARERTRKTIGRGTSSSCARRPGRCS